MTQYWNWGNIKSSGFQNEQQSGFIETTPDAGIPYRRQRFSDIGDIIQGSVTLTKGKYLQFMSWYKFNIKQGAIAFDYYDCRLETTRTARIIDKPTYSSNSTYFDVQVKLYLEPATIYQDVVLVADEDTILVADEDTELVASVKLRL